MAFRIEVTQYDVVDSLLATLCSLDLSRKYFPKSDSAKQYVTDLAVQLGNRGLTQVKLLNI